jgi:hypothetical protein
MEARPGKGEAYGSWTIRLICSAPLVTAKLPARISMSFIVQFLWVQSTLRIPFILIGRFRLK